MKIDLAPSGTSGETVAAARPKVSVIVPHYRDLVGLDRCLTALVAQTYPASDFEVIIADNASPEGAETVERVVAGRARLVVITEKGAGSARNGGVAVARGDILAFTDSDCVPEPDWLAEGVRALTESDFVGGRMKVLVDDADHMTPTEAFESVFAFDNRGYVANKGFTVSANLLCPRATFEKVGGFLPAGFAEDCEWCYRARGAGFKIGYAAKSIVGHPARKSWEDLLKKWRRANSDNYGVAARKPGGRIYWFFRSFALPISAVVHSPRVFTSSNLRNLKQRGLALSVLFRLRMWRFWDSLRLLVARGSV